MGSTRPSHHVEVTTLREGDRHYESLIADHPDAKQEIDLVRTAIATIGQFIQKSPGLNGNGTVWKQLTARAEEEKGVLCKYFDGKALFTGLLRLYNSVHREMWDSLQPESKEREVVVATQCRRRKRGCDSEDKTMSKKKHQRNQDLFRSSRNRGPWQQEISLLR
jgi:hypothetical protein